MMPESVSRVVYEFGSYLLVVDDGLFFAGKMVRLPPKELAVLTLLVSGQGKVVPKQEILDIIWAGDKQVSNGSLTRVIYVLRKLFEKQGFKYVETFHRRGYRFTAPIRRVEDPASVLAQLANRHSSPGQKPDQACRKAYQQGMTRLQFRHRRDLAQAITCFERAIELDPKSIDAHLGLAQAYRIRIMRSIDSSGSWHRGPREILERATTLATRHPTLRAIRAWSRAMFDWCWDEGLQRLDDLIAEHPRSAELLSEHASICLAIGQRDRAIREFRAVLEQNPYLPEANSCLIWALLCNGQTEEALAHARLTCERLPSISTVHAVLSGVAAHLGLTDEALSAGNRGLMLSDRDAFELCFMVTTLHQAGMVTMAHELYSELLALPFIPHSLVAPAVMVMDGTEACLRQLRLAIQTRCFFTPLVLQDPRLAEARGTPEFQSLFASVRSPLETSVADYPGGLELAVR
jgi:DNA-binding winged helix-turn-helix (wHTH) protein